VHTVATAPAQVIPANNWALQLQRTDPGITAFGTIHPAYGRFEHELDRLETAGIPGIKFHPDFQGFDMQDPAFFSVLEAVCGRFAVLFHVGDRFPPERSPSTPAKMKRIRRLFPQLTIIAAHLGGYLQWEESLRHLVGEDIYLDTSSSLPFLPDPLLQKIVSRHPLERILFGSDYPLFDPGEELDRIRDRLKLSGENFLSLLNGAKELI
jgi:hypothetical protein